MSFAPSYDMLPPTLPVFPLPQALVLPHAVLPLNIFEPRYLAMVEDALGEPCRLIGMIQPRESSEGPDAIYPVGCAGRISAFQETDDGRYIINLAGVSRFRVAHEGPTVRGYRRFDVDWSEFRHDLDPPQATFEVDSVKSALRRYGEQNQLSLSWESINPLDPVTLANVLTQSLPLDVAQKQMLLEAETPEDRSQLLTVLLGGTPGVRSLH